MLGALIIVFREAIEAGLIIGIVAAVTRGVDGSRRHIAGGVAAGTLGAVIVAAFAERLSQAFAGSGQELFNASVLMLAVVMLAWHNIWMARHGRELAQELSAWAASRSASVAALASLAFASAIPFSAPAIHLFFR